MATDDLLIHSRADPGSVACDSLELPFEMRCRSRYRAVLGSGDAAGVLLPRGTVLRGGDKVRASDGRVVEIVAAPEDLLEARCSGPTLARAAYHLGNRHVPVQVGEGWLRLAADHVLQELLRGLGVEVLHVRMAFEPESGAYAAGHTHATTAGARIHAFGDA